MDRPNPRKVHSSPVPRTGGVAVLIGTMVPLGFLLEGNPALLGIGLGALCLLVFGVLDDMKDIHWKWKLLGQCLAATVTVLVCNIHPHVPVAIWPRMPVTLGVLSYPLNIVFLMAAINIVNLADGLDGLAGGICLLTFSCVAFLAFFHGDLEPLAICVCVMGATVGFLRYNTYPAVVFLGDTGSQFLGFTAGVTVLLLTQREHSLYSPFLPLFILGVPVLDTALVVIERIRERRPIFQADRRHLHHLILDFGFRHNEAVVIIYAFQFIMVVLAWTMRFLPDAIILAAYLLLASAFLIFFSIHGKKQWLKDHEPRWSPFAESRTEIVRSKYLSRTLVAETAWYGVVGTVSLFYLVSPFFVRKVPQDIGAISIGFLIFLISLMATRFRTPLLLPTVKIAAFFIAVCTIAAFEFQMGSEPRLTQVRPYYNALFACMGACYFLSLVATLETMPLVTLDYLLLALVIFTFFLPRAYLEEFHVQSISARMLLVFLCIELIAYRLRGRFSFIWAPVFAALGLNIAFAFLL